MAYNQGSILKVLLKVFLLQIDKLGCLVIK